MLFLVNSIELEIVITISKSEPHKPVLLMVSPAEDLAINLSLRRGHNLLIEHELFGFIEHLQRVLLGSRFLFGGLGIDGQAVVGGRMFFVLFSKPNIWKDVANSE
ncbi:hypothetical protein TZ00_18490 [Agreia bicolorata]|uniref:Uncharacterized protein n=1 Tax=Agreia bicolorata TaxID=110935 RepID=A0ABR5CBD9_9MICO|nr:hypothetical protein TZ00_18490 [Agreia bicolorata]